MSAKDPTRAELLLACVICPYDNITVDNMARLLRRFPGDRMAEHLVRLSRRIIQSEAWPGVECAHCGGVTVIPLEPGEHLHATTVHKCPECGGETDVTVAPGRKEGE